jgi:hypothetical protein
MRTVNSSIPVNTRRMLGAGLPSVSVRFVHTRVSYHDLYACKLLAFLAPGQFSVVKGGKFTGSIPSGFQAYRTRICALPSRIHSANDLGDGRVTHHEEYAEPIV